MVAVPEKLEFTILPEDYQLLVKVILRRLSKAQSVQQQSWGGQLKVFLLWVVIGLSAISLYNLAKNSGYISGHFFAYIAPKTVLAFFLGILVTTVLQSWYARWVTKKQFTASGALTGFHHARIEDNGLHLSSSTISTHYQWSAFEDVSEKEHLLFLWIDRGVAVVIPANAFSNGEEKQAFIEMVKERSTANGQ